MYKIVVTLSLLIFTNLIYSQKHFELQQIPSIGFCIDVNVGKGYTWYGMSRATGQTVGDVITFNSKTEDNLSLDDIIRLPVSSEKIFINQAELNHPVALYYQVTSGDNLYRIATALNKSLSDLALLNDKTSYDLSIDERVLIGWLDWPYASESNLLQKPALFIEKLMVSNNLQPVISLNHKSSATLPMQSMSNDLASVPTLVTEKGIAFWQKENCCGDELIVMHPSARLNSKISLYNPMLNRKVDAKVVSELPRESYPKDISVVISPSVASALGALDRRFLVEITYVE